MKAQFGRCPFILPADQPLKRVVVVSVVGTVVAGFLPLFRPAGAIECAARPSDVCLHLSHGMAPGAAIIKSPLSWCNGELGPPPVYLLLSVPTFRAKSHLNDSCITLPTACMPF
jgi:hypothetical protein